MPRVRIFATIAVHDPKGGLAALPGVLTSARRMADWARAHGYEVVSISDEGKKDPVTVTRIREALEEKFWDIVEVRQQTIDRLVIYFAGHGLVKSDQSSFWLLSDWERDWSEAVSVQSLQRILRYYNPGQVALIGDACRSLGRESFDIVGSAVLKRPDEEPQSIEIDQFFAAEAGEPAYMAQAKDGKDAFCIFTEVLLDALEGDASDAFDNEIDGVLRVTSQSLGTYLLSAIPTVAGKHGVVMKAEPHPGFATDRVYVQFGSKPPDGRRQILKAGVGREGRRRVTSKVELRAVQTTADRDRDVRALDADRAARVREVDAAIRFWSVASVPTHYESGCGLAVNGAAVARVDTLYGGSVVEDRRGTWYRVETDRPGNDGFVDLVVTLQTGDIAYVCALQGFIAALTIDRKGEASVQYRKVSETTADRDQGVLGYIARMKAGLLTGDEAASVAANIRFLKHVDPSLGCIAAYLYDSIGDIDSIRKTASYYPQNGQMVPLDIALLSGLEITMGEDGALTIDIPATKKREPRTNAEAARQYTFAATSAWPRVRIAGHIPWMRGGWSAVETAYVDASASDWRANLLLLAAERTASPFSVLKTGVMDQLVSLIRREAVGAGAA